MWSTRDEGRCARFRSRGMSSRSWRFFAAGSRVRMPGAQRGQRLLAHAADRQHAAAQRHLAGHRHVARAPACRSPATTIAAAIAMPADGPSLGIAPAGTCTWISLRSERLVDAELRRAPAHEGQRRGAGLLHHVAELAGQHQPARRGSRSPRSSSTSPPASVQASPLATPTSAGRRRSSGPDVRRAEQAAQRARSTRARLARRPRPGAAPPCGRSRRAGARGCARRPRACTGAITLRSAASDSLSAPATRPCASLLARDQVAARDLELLLRRVARPAGSPPCGRAAPAGSDPAGWRWR